MHREDGHPIVPIDEIVKEKTSQTLPVTVRTYDGHRAASRPLAFDLRGESWEIEEILFAWIEETSDGRTRRFCYDVVAGPDRVRCVLFLDQGSKKWYVRIEDIEKSDK